MTASKPRSLAASVVAATLVAALAACATVGLQSAPIVDRSASADRSAPITSAAPAAVSGAAAVSATEPGGDATTYVVQRGDTLYSIALAYGRDYRDLARWNGLDDPTRLKVGQALRVRPPSADDDGSGAPATVDAGNGVEVVPLGVVARPATPTGVAPLPATTSEATPAAPAGAAGVDAVAGAWAWPAQGKVIARFDDPRNKGIDIDGHEGDPVVAAGDGTVVYSGNSLRGYGNLVIIKHSDDFISAYAHNREIVVGQGQVVKRGQRIAALGKSDADAPRLHFEIRRQGKPVDPARYLPAR